MTMKEGHSGSQISTPGILQNKEVKEHLAYLRMIHGRRNGGPPPALRSTPLPAPPKPRSATKIRTAIRLCPDVVEAFKADGAGWQTRINEALREFINEQG